MNEKMSKRRIQIIDLQKQEIEEKQEIITKKRDFIPEKSSFPEVKIN